MSHICDIQIGLESMYARARANILKLNREHRLQRGGESSGNYYYDSNVVYSLIVFSRDTVEFFRKSSSSSFSSTTNSVSATTIIDIVTASLYAGLMRDVRLLFEDHMSELDDVRE
jgi:hypothetical protein